MTTKTTKTAAPKVDAALTLWESLEDTTKDGLAAIGAAAASADAALEGAPAEYATRCREIAAAVLYGPRGTQAAIGRGIQSETGGSLDAAKKAAERYAKVGRILIAQPDQDPMKVRTFIRDAKDEEIVKAIESGRLVVAPKAPKAPGKRGAGKEPGKGTRTWLQQRDAATRETAKVITMAKAADALPSTGDLDPWIASLETALKAARAMRETVAASEKTATA